MRGVMRGLGWKRRDDHPGYLLSSGKVEASLEPRGPRWYIVVTVGSAYIPGVLTIERCLGLKATFDTADEAYRDIIGKIPKELF